MENKTDFKPYIKAEKDGEYVQVTLRNISAEELKISPEELTERFVRGDASRNTEGSGLGLAILHVSDPHYPEKGFHSGEQHGTDHRFCR